MNKYSDLRTQFNTTSYSQEKFFGEGVEFEANEEKAASLLLTEVPDLFAQYKASQSEPTTGISLTKQYEASAQAENYDTSPEIYYDPTTDSILGSEVEVTEEFHDYRHEMRKFDPYGSVSRDRYVYHPTITHVEVDGRNIYTLALNFSNENLYTSLDSLRRTQVNEVSICPEESEVAIHENPNSSRLVPSYQEFLEVFYESFLNPESSTSPVEIDEQPTPLVPEQVSQELPRSRTRKHITALHRYFNRHK